MTTPTPRTDAATYWTSAHYEGPAEVESVDADFARQLERELAAAQERNTQLVKALDDMYGTPCEQIRHQQELEAAQDALKRAEELAESYRKDAERYRWLRQRIEVRQQQAGNGAIAPALVTGIGAAFLHIPAPQQAHRMKRSDELDAAIDAAVKESKT